MGNQNRPVISLMNCKDVTGTTLRQVIIMGQFQNQAIFFYNQHLIMFYVGRQGIGNIIKS